ncbi:hypothetical protein [Nesterenkonia sp. F]|uniref:hypothetical protein n=1 Tax=Nesterenkonia sp. F TaxID=795955 RepID=UPI000255CE3C|nr:hypothetical protein [Nesterenkonia sp. F]
MTAYVDQIVGDGISEDEFSFFMGSYRPREVDVVHFYDVAGFLGGRRRTSEERFAAATEIVEDVRSRGIALIRTVIGSPERQDAAAALLDQATDRFVVLDRATPTPDPQRTTFIPHAHHRERFLGYPRGEKVPGRLLCIARAGVGRSAEGPLKTFSVTDTPGLSLRVVGEEDPTIASTLSRAVRRNREAVSSRTEMLSDAELIREIDGAELVILPEVESLNDMGLLFTVLSMDRPVLMPDGPAARQLAEDVGAGWVMRHSGPITAESVDEAVGALRKSSRSERPNLEGRDISSTGESYAEVYREAKNRTASVYRS